MESAYATLKAFTLIITIVAVLAIVRGIRRSDRWSVIAGTLLLFPAIVATLLALMRRDG